MTQRELERKISRTYAQARKNIARHTEEYFKDFKKRDEIKRREVTDGITTEKEYEQWLNTEKAYMSRNEQLLRSVSEEYRNADKTAAKWINGELPYSYVSGYNSTGKGISGDVTGYSFSLVDKNAVKSLMSNGDIPIATYTAGTEKHTAYVDKKARQAITAGIIQGDGATDVAVNVSKALGTVTEKERKATIRNTRTLMNGAHNAGGYEAMASASKDGIILDKQWLATKDERTRDSHAHLDGEIRKWNERFSNGLRYPQDPQGEAGEVYNCRCAMREITRGFYNKYTGKTVLLGSAPQDEYAAESKAYWNKYFAEKKQKESTLAAAENPNYSNKLLKNSAERGIINNRNMANGGRTSVHHILTNEEIENLKAEAKSIEIPTDILRFNEGSRTGFSDLRNVINVKGDVLPDNSSTLNRDRMTSRACLAHEYYGHYINHPSRFPVDDWRDEFKASYDAALNTPNLTKAERQSLMIDAYDRAKEVGISVKYNENARRIIYGDD